MKPRDALVWGAEVVAFLFGAFSGFLTNLAPPLSRAGGTPANLAVGTASMVSLVVFLLARLWVTPRTVRQRRAWTAVTVACLLAGLLSAWGYQRSYARHTFVYPLSPDSSSVEIVSDELTDDLGKPAVERFRQRYGHAPTPRELIERRGGDLDEIPKIWTRESLLSAYERLLLLYVLATVLLVSAVASAVELVFRREGARRTGA